MSTIDNSTKEILLPRYDQLFSLLSNTTHDKHATHKRHMLIDKREERIHIYIYGANKYDYATEFDFRAVENFARYHCNDTVNIVYKKGQLHLLGTGCKLSEKDVISKIQSHIIEQLIEYKQVLPKQYNGVLPDCMIIVSKKNIPHQIANIPHINDLALPDIYFEELQYGTSI